MVADAEQAGRAEPLVEQEARNPGDDRGVGCHGADAVGEHRAEERHDDAKKAIDLAADRMASQIRKAHERRASRDRRTSLADLPLATEAAPIADERTVVVRTKRHAIKPIDVDEAIEQMELLGHTFFVFQNADSGKIEVLYRRNDGAYGLIVPDPA